MGRRLKKAFALGKCFLLFFLIFLWGCGDLLSIAKELARNHGFIYGTTSNYSTGYAGHVIAFAIKGEGNLTFVEGSPFAAGTDTRSIAVTPSGKFVYTANYGSDNISVFSIDPNTGRLTAVAGSPFPAEGHSPFFVAVHPTGKFVYVTNEGNGTVSAFGADATNGTLSNIAGSPFATGDYPSCIIVEPKGKFAYVANSASNNISAFKINADGSLTSVADFTAGTDPFSLVVESTGKFLYAFYFNSNNISAFRIDPATGSLTDVPGSPFTSEGSRVWESGICTSGNFMYVVNQLERSVSAFTIDSTSGALKTVTGSPFTNEHAIVGAGSVVLDPSGKFLYTTYDTWVVDQSTGALNFQFWWSSRPDDMPCYLAATSAGL